MKKILCLILIFTLLFSVSCNVADGGDILSEHPSESKSEVPESSPPSEESGSVFEEDLQPEESTSSLEESIPQEESNNVPPEESYDKAEENEDPSGAGCHYYPTFNTYEEYEEFVGSIEKLPDDFITYDMLKDFGSFRSFRFVDNNEYNYNFIDENGWQLFVTITSLPNEIKSYPIATPYNSSNLRTSDAPEGLWSAYSHNNIIYYYYNGELERMECTIGSRLVELSYVRGQLSETNSFAVYPLDGETTFVSQLLSLETAEAAVENFNQHVEAEIAKNIADKQSKG